MFNYPYVENDGHEVLDMKSDLLRMLRGGSFKRNLWTARCAIRNQDLPMDFSAYIGTRVVLSFTQRNFGRMGISFQEHYGEEFTRE